MNFNFNIDDAVSVLNELMGIACDIAQERKFINGNREALGSRNPFSIANRLDVTHERYKTPIEILSKIADKIPPPPQEKPSFRMKECQYCPNYNRQDSVECQNCHILTFRTDMIPIYAVMQKAGEKGIEWGVDWLLKQLTSYENAVKIKKQFYAERRQITGGDWV